MRRFRWTNESGPCQTHLGIRMGVAHFNRPCHVSMHDLMFVSPHLQIPVPVPMSNTRWTFFSEMGARYSLLPMTFVMSAWFRSKRSISLYVAAINLQPRIGIRPRIPHHSAGCRLGSAVSTRRIKGRAVMLTATAEGMVSSAMLVRVVDDAGAQRCSVDGADSAQISKDERLS